MPRSLLAILAAAAATALLPGCKREFTNPFESAARTATPPPGAALLFTSNAYASTPGAARDIFAAADDGSELTRLTSCNTGGRRCDALEAAIAPDRQRLAVRRVDGGEATDPAALVFVDLARNVEGTLVPSSARVMGVDWSPKAEVLVYSADGSGGIEDIYRVDSNGLNPGRLTETPGARERHPRIDPTGTMAAYERVDETGGGEIWIFRSGSSQTRVVPAPPAGAPLPGTPYVVGSAADPAYSPDGRSVVFRRLTGMGDGTRGTWDILTAAVDGSRVAVVASGPAYRGAPDWGGRGIVFPETDPASGTTSLVVVPPDGSSRRTVMSVGPGFTISSPRWLP